MKKDDVLLLIAALTLAELTLLVVLAYRFYQAEQPQLAALQKAGSGLSGIVNLFEGKTATTTP